MKQDEYDKLCCQSLSFWEKVAASPVFDSLYRWLHYSRNKLLQCRAAHGLDEMTRINRDETLKVLKDSKSQIDAL